MSTFNVTEMFGTTRFGPGAWNVAHGGRAPRIAMYAHDSQGLGHTRRNLLIAQAISNHVHGCSILLLSGALETRSFKLPAGTDLVTLPSLYKNGAGSYTARRLTCSFDSLIALRSAIISSALESFRPDVLIVDNVPAGAGGELLPALNRLRQEGVTKIVLGLRDILDAPAVIEAEWRKTGADRLVQSVYDAIWIYGDRAVYDATREYKFLANVRSIVRFTGYLDQQSRPRVPDERVASLVEKIRSSGQRLLLCLVGGGQDGGTLATAFAATRFPSDAAGVLLTGPYMPAETANDIARLASGRNDLDVLGFVSEPASLIEAADRVISMGGYNAVGEVLSYGASALIVPRTTPRREQLLRATRLSERGLVDMLHPADLSPDALEAWLADTSADRPRAFEALDLAGLTKIPVFLNDLISNAPHAIHADTRISGD